MTKQVQLLARYFSAWISGLNGIGTVLIFALMIMINLDVFSRFLFNAPIDGVTELVELSIVAIVFLQISDAVRAGRLTRSDGLYSRILKRHPIVGHCMGLVFDLAGALFFVAILLGSMPRLIEAYERSYYAGNKGIFTVPIWPIRLILVIGCITVVFVFFQFIWKHFSAIRQLRQGTP